MALGILVQEAIQGNKVSAIPESVPLQFFGASTRLVGEATVRIGSQEGVESRDIMSICQRNPALQLEIRSELTVENDLLS